MNDHDFHFRVRQHLNSSAHAPADGRGPPTPVKANGTGPPERAVRGSVCGHSQTLSEHTMPRGRTAVSVLLVVVAALGVGYLGELQRIADLEEVDSALRRRPPIDAYLDSGLDAWVQNDSPD